MERATSGKKKRRTTVGSISVPELPWLKKEVEAMSAEEEEAWQELEQRQKARDERTT